MLTPRRDFIIQTYTLCSLPLYLLPIGNAGTFRLNSLYKHMYIPGKRKQLRASSGIQEEMLSTHDPAPSGANWEAHRAHLCLCPSAPTHSPHLVGVADEAGWVGCTWVVWERAGFLQLRLQLHLPVWLGGRTGLGNSDFSPCLQRYSISLSNPTSIQYPSEN